MHQYFGINIEFNHNKFENTVNEISSVGKGYSCFVDSTLLVLSHREKGDRLRYILNGACANSCDGSHVALMASILHKEKLKAYNGPEFFNKFIYYPDKQCIIGNTEDVFLRIKRKIELTGMDSSNLKYIPTPYLSIDEFDYESLANEINQFGPRYIWVSLGAPKQEEFMSRIIPFIDKGVLIGVGAALNYFSGEIKNIPKWATKMNLIWFFRIMTEPKKQLYRSLMIFASTPGIFLKEYKRIIRK